MCGPIVNVFYNNNPQCIQSEESEALKRLKVHQFGSSTNKILSVSQQIFIEYPHKPGFVLAVGDRVLMKAGVSSPGQTVEFIFWSLVREVLSTT